MKEFPVALILGSFMAQEWNTETHNAPGANHGTDGFECRAALKVYTLAKEDVLDACVDLVHK